MDLWGLAQMTSLGGMSYYISFMDDYTQETKIKYLKAKSEALEAFKRYETHLTHQNPGIQLHKVQSDRGGEYLSTEFDKYLADQGIECQLTIHDLPQQNRVAEYLNRTLVELARAMLIGHDLPKFLWAETVNYACWLKNFLPSSAIPSATPHEFVHRTKPNLSMAHKFGTRVYVHQLGAGKLEAHAEEAIFIGVNTDSKGYQVYWLDKRQVLVERNIVFVPPNIRVDQDVLDEGESRPSDEISTHKVRESSSNTPSIHPIPVTPADPTPTLNAPECPRLAPGYYAQLQKGQTVTVTTSSLKKASELDLLDEEAHIHLALAVAEPESILQQALNGPDGPEWQEALDYEISQLEKLGTWEIVDLPCSVNLIPCHFVLATKQGPDGEKLKLRACLIANGQQQQYGVDFFDTFAPTANMSTIRVVLSMVAQKDWEIHQVDIKSTYLYANV
jgi:hypothetical protein